MQGKLTLLAFGVLVGLSGQADAGVTLVNPKEAVVRRKGVTSSTKVKTKVKRPTRKASEVLISVKDADLRAVVLPMFEKQVGVKIRWVGPERKVTLRLSQPLHWEVALELVCQFTQTHSTADRHGNMILKPKWGGHVDPEKEFDDLGGKLATPRRYSRAAKLASAPRNRQPVTTQPKLSYFKIGGSGGGARGQGNKRYQPQRYRVPSSRTRQTPQRYKPQRYRVPTSQQRYKPQTYRAPRYRVQQRAQRYTAPRSNQPRYRPQTYRPPRYRP